MTVKHNYSRSDPSTMNLVRILLRWKGSIYGLVYKDCLVYLTGYYLLHLIYNYALNESSKRYVLNNTR